jgi:hypothetical protein
MDATTHTALTDNAFAILSFLAAPAVLTNASTLLALGTSNRLARAADRARAASALIVATKANDPSDLVLNMHKDDFESATRRAELLILALRRFYLSAGCFAGGTCIALLGAFAEYFDLRALSTPAQVLTILVALLGVAGLVHGSLTLLQETRIALNVLKTQHAAITTWRATRQPPEISPTN